MSQVNFILLLSYAVLLAAGQIAFKFVSRSLPKPLSLVDTAFLLPFNGWFWLTGIFYAVSMIYWIWLLGRIPLTLAYPVTSIAFIILPIFSFLFFHETVTIKYFIGVAFVMLGLSMIVT